jgi:hypothetical protein
MSSRLREYHLELASSNATRRFWAEYYLDIPRPPEQQELDLMREVLHHRLISHLQQTELRGPVFCAAPLEDWNAGVVRKQIVSALVSGTTVVNSDIEIGGVCLSIPAIRLDKESGAFHVQALAGHFIAEPSSSKSFENSARVLGSALKEFADSEEWGLRWPWINVEVQPWAPTADLSSKSSGVTFDKLGSGFLIGSDVFREARSRLMAAVSDPLEPPGDGNVFLSMDAAFLSDREPLCDRPFAGNAAFRDVPAPAVPRDDDNRGWLLRELSNLQAEGFCGDCLPPELMTERAVFLAAARVPVSARRNFESPGIGLLTARYLQNGRAEERVFSFEEMARGRDSFFDFCKRIRGRTIVLSPGTYAWNSDLRDSLALISHGLLDGVKEPCELLDCYAHRAMAGNAQSPEAFASAFRIAVPPPSPAFATGENSTALELLRSKAGSEDAPSLQSPVGSYFSRALERCRWETKVFMRSWQEMERRAEVLLRYEADLEKVVDGTAWKLLASAKIDSALELGGSSRSCINNRSNALASGGLDLYPNQGLAQKEFAWR